MSERIDAIVIGCTARDLWRARALVAALRHWHGDIRIELAADDSLGRVACGDLMRYWGVNRYEGPYPELGGYWWKFRCLLEPAGRRLLWLDADTMLTGPLLEDLEAVDADLVVCAHHVPADSEQLTISCYLPEEVRKLEPDFRYPGFFFNNGHVVVRTGKFALSDFEPWLGSVPDFEVKHPEAFLCPTQGALNFIAGKMVAEGRLTVAGPGWEWMQWAYDREVQDHPYSARVSWTHPQSKRPVLVHWVGPKRSRLAYTPFARLLQQHLKTYYGKLPWGKLRHWRDWWAALQSEKIPGGPRRWLFALTAWWTDHVQVPRLPSPRSAFPWTVNIDRFRRAMGDKSVD